MRLILLFVMFSASLNAQGILGEWKSVDKNGVSKCIVSIYEDNGKVFGKIVELLVEDADNALCVNCKGEDKNKPFVGLRIIKDLEKDGKYYRNGTIFDPENGQEFRCRLVLKDNKTLQVRGYLAFVYSTQYWVRVEA